MQYADVMTYAEMREWQIAKALDTEGWGRVPHFILPDPDNPWPLLRTNFFQRPYSQPNTLALDSEAQTREKQQNRKHFT